MMNNTKIIKRKFKICLMIYVLSYSCSVWAENLGIYGQTYAIQEEDFLEFVQNKIRIMQGNGEWKKLESQFKENVKRHADRPTPVVSVTKTTEYRSWNYNPSIAVPYDLHDAEGHIIAKAGTIVNPLHYISLHKIIIFFDGDDSKQVLKVQKIDNEFKGKTKLVLVNGSISENEKRFLKPIYFDQEERLIKRFHITHVPAVIEQENNSLKVMEIPS